VLKPKKPIVALHRDSKDVNGMNAYNHKKNNFSSNTTSNLYKWVIINDNIRNDSSKLKGLNYLYK
jgi:hypothetical protein